MTIPLTPSENQLLAKLMELHTDEITAILGKTGLDVDLALTSQENYSERTRKRAYWPRVQKAFRGIPESYRAAYFASLSEILLEQAIGRSDSESDGHRLVGETTGDTEDRRFARIAIEEARKSVPEDERVHPKVGAVIVKDGRVLATAHRGELPGNHAEFIALEKKLSAELIAGATVYTTLEPCTYRNEPKNCVCVQAGGAKSFESCDRYSRSRSKSVGKGMANITRCRNRDNTL